MKLKFTKFSCGLAAAALAFALVACDDSSSATVPYSEEISSASEAEGVNNHNGKGNGGLDIESSADAESSESGDGYSSANQDGSSSSAIDYPTCDALIPECGYTEQDLCDMGIQTYCEDFGNCYDDNGNDVNCGDLPRSSSSTEKCSHISDRKEIYGDNVSFTPCMDGTRALDCKNYQDYTCIGGEWHIALVILGGDCLAEGSIVRVAVDDEEDYSSFVYVPYQCKDGKWREYSEDEGIKEDCRLNAIVGTSCDEEKLRGELLAIDGCHFMCLDGKYEYLPPPRTTAGN